MGEFDRFGLDQLLAIAQANRPAVMESEAEGWDATAWLLEAQVQRLEAAVARLRTIWDSPAADRFVGEIAKVRETLASGHEKAAGNARSWRAIAARNGRLVDDLAELSLSRHNARADVKAKYDQDMSRHEENFGWAGGLGDLLAPDPPNFGPVDNRADVQARQLMTTADGDFTAEYRANLWEPPRYQGPTAVAPSFDDVDRGGSGAGGSGGSGGAIGAASRGGGVPGTAQPPLFDPPAGLPGEGPVLAGPPAAPPIAPPAPVPPALPPVGAGPGAPPFGPPPALPPFVPPGGGVLPPGGVRPPGGVVPPGGVRPPGGVVPPGGAAPPGGVVPPGGIRPVPPGRAPLIPPLPPSSPPVTGGRPVPPGGRPPVVPPGNASVVGRGVPPVGTGGRPQSAAPARRIVADPVTGRPVPTGAARPAVTGHGPANPGILGQRDPRAGSAGTAGARAGRRREPADRGPDVAGENDLWFVDDDLPAVIEPADRADPGAAQAGPHVGGGRRV